MRISDWSSDVCSSDLRAVLGALPEVSDRLVADHVVGMAAEAHRCVVDDELRIEVAALATQDRPVAEAARSRLDVPLADHGGVVAGVPSSETRSDGNECFGQFRIGRATYH